MLPGISIIIPTLNSARTLAACLASIREQDYPQELLEIIVVDGGSQDATEEISRHFKTQIIQDIAKRDNPEARKAVGLAKATKELVAFIDSDNLLPHRHWLKYMVEPLLLDKEIIATQPLRYHYQKSFSLLNRYFALFGVNDPIAYYFNKRDRLSWQENTWRMLGKAEDKGKYYKVVFEKDKLPTLGANGYLARREILLKAKVSPEEFFHIDINYDLVTLGYDKYGIIKDDIIHLTADNLFSFLKKRAKYMRSYHSQKYSLRRYRLFEPADKYKLAMFIIFSLTFIWPLIDSARGFLKIHDLAWFIHPLVCFGIVLAYGLEWAQGIFLK